MTRGVDTTALHCGWPAGVTTRAVLYRDAGLPGKGANPGTLVCRSIVMTQVLLRIQAVCRDFGCNGAGVACTVVAGTGVTWVVLLVAVGIVVGIVVGAGGAVVVVTAVACRPGPAAR